MNVIIFGGQGRTGQLVAKEAAKRGHAVSVFTFHDNHTLPKNIRVIEGNARDAKQVAQALAGHDAVINIIAPKLFDRKNYDISEVATKNIIHGMHMHNIRRYQGQAGAWATEYMSDASLLMRLSFLLVPMFRGIYGVKKREDQIVKASKLDWTLVRCGLLTGKTEPETMQISKNGRYKCTLLELPKISRHSVARFHVDILEDTSYFNTTPIVIAK